MEARWKGRETEVTEKKGEGKLEREISDEKKKLEKIDQVYLAN